MSGIDATSALQEPVDLVDEDYGRCELARQAAHSKEMGWSKSVKTETGILPCEPSDNKTNVSHAQVQIHGR